MDLGAPACTPKSPNCWLCPLRPMCTAQGEGDPERYPIKPKKVPKPTRLGHVYVLFGEGRSVMTERRPDKGLLGGMLGLPTSDWAGDWPAADFPSEGEWEEIGEVRHVFTHFALTLKVWRAEAADPFTPATIAAAGLPSVFAKALKLAR